MKPYTREAIGKTIAKIDVYFKKQSTDVHESDVLRIQFTDDTVMWIQTASNADNIISDIESGKTNFQTKDFHADFVISWEHNIHK